MEKIKLCKCGCGDFAKLGNIYIYGHHRRNKKMPKEIVERIRKKLTGRKMPEGFGEKQRQMKLGKPQKHRENCLCPFCKAKRGEMKGERNPMYGKHHSKESKRKMRKGHTMPKDFGEILRRAKTGRKHSKKHPSTKHSKKHIMPKGFGERQSKLRKKSWQNPEYREKTLKAMFAARDSRPTKPEKKLRRGLNKLFPGEYKYVGDGSIFIGYKNPDFININGQKKVIEMFGNYWHSEEVTGRTKQQEENQRIRHFAKYGFKTLIVWERELLNIQRLKRKLIRFDGI